MNISPHSSPYTNSPFHIPIFIVFSLGLCMGSFVAQPWLNKYGAIHGVPIQVLLLWLTGCTSIILLARRITRLRILTLWEILAITVIIFSVLVHGLFSNDLRNTARVCTGLIVFCAASLLVRDLHAWKTSMFIIGAFILASGVIALLQYVGLAPWSRVLTVYALYPDGKPSTGLESNPVTYAYSVIAFLTYSACYMAFDLTRRRPTLFLVFCFIFFGTTFTISSLGLILAASRSGLLGLATGFTISLLLSALRRPKSSRSITGMSSFLILSFFALSTYHLYFWLEPAPTPYGLSSKTDVTSDNRLGGTWITFGALVLSHPLGFGAYEIDDIRADVNVWDDPLRDALAKNAWYAPHNIFLTTALQFGIPAALAQLFLFVSILCRAIKSLNINSSNNEYFLLPSLIAANVSVLVHSWFHNPSLATTEMRNWFWLGACATAIASARTNRAPHGTPALPARCLPHANAY